MRGMAAIADFHGERRERQARQGQIAEEIQELVTGAFERHAPRLPIEERVGTGRPFRVRGAKRCMLLRASGQEKSRIDRRALQKAGLLTLHPFVMEDVGARR